MARTTDELSGITLLGSSAPVKCSTYDASILESFLNQHEHRDYWVTFTCPEFTSLCPVTGQPDFATIMIQYIPGQKMVESKSLKLYLFGYRNRGDFHEDCVNMIMQDLVKLLEPKYIEVIGKFTARGGIAITPFVNYGRPGTDYERLAAERFQGYNMVKPD